MITLTVHDEIVVSAPEHLADKAASLVKDAMVGEGIQKLVNVPLSCDIKVVNRWSDAK